MDIMAKENAPQKPCCTKAGICSAEVMLNMLSTREAPPRLHCLQTRKGRFASSAERLHQLLEFQTMFSLSLAEVSLHAVRA